VKNRKTTDGLRASDSKNNSDDSCEVVVPKLGIVLRNINEVMTCLKHQTDNEHLHLLHLINVKHYDLKSCSSQFLKTALCNCFCEKG
jgi:hypothetical protein